MGSLSGLTQVLSPALTLTGIPGALVGAGTQLLAQQRARDQLRAEQDIALSQLQARQAQDEGNLAANTALEKSRLAAEATAAESRRKTALRRAIGRQKTLFSAQGMSPDGGSSEAVLLGLYNEGMDDDATQTRLDRLRTTALDQNLSAQKQKNLLEAAQLAERQNLARILIGR